ncbi:MAG: GMC family oxidoreductase [Bryobacter sp.]|nr:GMC family oxidoreductase [Bryobacter sp.]
MQIKTDPKTYDVVIVGSGAAGGMAAWNLTRQGVEVLVLDAGEKFNRNSFWSHVRPWEARARMARGQRPPQFTLTNDEQPYLTPNQQDFQLVRVWGRGGKTNIWGRVSLRFSDANFQEPAQDGHEIPWPIRYAELAPYYDKVEQWIGVCGGTDDQEFLPGSQHHLPAPALRCGEHIMRRAANSVGINIVNTRRAVLTKQHNGKAPCHYCGACGKGCDISAFFNSSDYLLEPAFQTGKLELRDNAVVSHVTTGPDGLANGVHYFDRKSGEAHQVKARVVVMAASCVDSTRILLNSKSSRYPNGIANSNDVIGRYLCEQVRFHIFGFAPELKGKKAQNDDGIGGEHIYMPRWRGQSKGSNKFLRGYGSQFWNTGAQANASYAKHLPGFGKGFKENVKRGYPALIAMHPYGEVLPYADNRITLHKTRKDKFGIPLPTIDYKIRENERAMIEAMYDSALEIMTAAKAEILPYERGWIDRLGSAIHEHGTCRMGDDPKRSALNKFNQAHEVKNLFVVDGSSFPTATEKNPTLTILALSMRATDYLADELKKRNL